MNTIKIFNIYWTVSDGRVGLVVAVCLSIINTDGQTGKTHIGCSRNWRLSVTPQNNSILMVRGVSGRPSIRPPWCQKTPASRTAVRPIAVVFPAWTDGIKQWTDRRFHAWFDAQNLVWFLLNQTKFVLWLHFFSIDLVHQTEFRLLRQSNR